MKSKEILIAFVLVALSSLVTTLHSNFSEYKIVDTRSGRIRGIREFTFFENKPFHSYRGIPYAEKPIGSLRFKVNISRFGKIIEFYFEF